MSIVKALVELLELEQLEMNIYRGQNRDLGTGRVYGGQVFAQALVAARRTVSEPREAHSVHGYFLRAGDLKAPIVFFVDRPRDGGTFTSRRVTAIQHGEAIFHLSASFQISEPGLDHQAWPMPDVPDPDSLKPELEQIREKAERLPPELREVLTQDRPIDFRSSHSHVPGSEHGEPQRFAWFRVQDTLPDDLITHQAVLAYASDYGLLPTSLLPHGVSYRDPRLQLASLDHTLWMHRPFRADEWLLYVMDSPTAAGARGFTRGQVYTKQGQLVASVAQEGLIRLR
ncbi:MAG: acyl-CoA thioesterase II [Gemmatimonadaceae bacterium]|nr:acyl-CoA thioesterase II [Gemmatimonadaceae bacterium]